MAVLVYLPKGMSVSFFGKTRVSRSSQDAICAERCITIIITITLPPIIMEVENGVLEDVFSLQMGYFPLPWLWEGRYCHCHYYISFLVTKLSSLLSFWESMHHLLHQNRFPKKIIHHPTIHVDVGSEHKYPWLLSIPSLKLTVRTWK